MLFDSIVSANANANERKMVFLAGTYVTGISDEISDSFLFIGKFINL